MEKKLSFKQQMMIKREEVIIETVINLLSTKGYDAMTVDEVAEIVGVSKPSLYRHFHGKEALAVAALLNTMNDGLEQIEQINAQENLTAIEKLQQITAWAMRLKLDQKMPNLPSENSLLVSQLKDSQEYIDKLVDMSEAMGEWIESAKEDGKLSQSIPSVVILYTLYARACDPVLTFLKKGELFSDEQIIEYVTHTCFNGLTH